MVKISLTEALQMLQIITLSKFGLIIGSL